MTFDPENADEILAGGEGSEAYEEFADAIEEGLAEALGLDEDLIEVVAIYYAEEARRSSRRSLRQGRLVVEVIILATAEDMQEAGYADISAVADELVAQAQDENSALNSVEVFESLGEVAVEVQTPIAGVCYAEVCVTVVGADVNYVSTADIAGFQLSHNGCVEGASGGDTETYGFSVTVASDKIIAFSFAGAVIPTGSGTLFVIEGDVSLDCIFDPLFSDSNANELTSELKIEEVVTSTTTSTSTSTTSDQVCYADCTNGDLDHSGAIDILDVTLVIDVIILTVDENLQTNYDLVVDTCGCMSGDYNGDNTVTILDCVQMVAYIFDL